MQDGVKSELEYLRGRPGGGPDSAMPGSLSQYLHSSGADPEKAFSYDPDDPDIDVFRVA